MASRFPGLAILVVGVTASVLARRLPTQAGFGLGPAFLPFWTGLVLAGCGLLLTVWPRDAEETEPLRGAALVRVAAGFAVLLFYALTLEPLGYLLSTVLFLAGSMLFLYRMRPGRALVATVSGALLLFVIFRVWLRVPLPVGFLGW